MIERDRRTINITEYFILYGLCKLCIFLDTKFSKCRYRAEQNLLGGTPRRVRGGADAPPRHRFPSFRVSSKSSGPVCFILQTFCFVLNYIFITSLVGIYLVFSLNLYIIKTCTNIYPVWSIVVDTHTETHTYTHSKYCVQTAMFGSSPAVQQNNFYLFLS